MSKYVKVDQETCIACGSCGDIAPDLFDFLEDGTSYVILDDNSQRKEVPLELYDDLQEAIENCPTDSIKIYETPLAQ